jgi:hypothetical protein
MDEINQSRQFMAAAWETAIGGGMWNDPYYTNSIREPEKLMCGHCAFDADTIQELSDHVQGNHRYAW